MEGKKYFRSTPKNKQNNNRNDKKQGKPFDKTSRKPFDKGQKRPFDKEFRKPNNPEVKENVENKENSKIRYYIYKCLYNIYENKAFSNIEIDHVIRENKINALDAKLLTNIVYGTLHHERVLDWEIKKLCNKEPKEQARVILLMSLYQMKYLDRIPAFAILNEAVSIAKKEGGDAMGNFVNAILRESQRQNLVYSKENAKDEYEYLSVYYNMPVWVIKMWEIHYGKQKTIELLENNMLEPPTSVRVNIHKTSKEEMLKNADFVEGKLASNSLIYNGTTPIASTEEFKNGFISVQDESSQYVVEILDPKENEKVLDMCAAPGSKTQYIAELMKNTGKILALDIHPHRVEIMKSYLNTLGITNTVCKCFDSTLLHEHPKLIGSFDKVLLDAPCLGLGVIRRKPDILHDLTSKNLDELEDLQAKLLDEAYLMLKENGELVYSTCSIDKKENNLQVLEFLGKHKDMKKVFEKQIFPDEYNSDGFYICKMVKE